MEIPQSVAGRAVRFATPVRTVPYIGVTGHLRTTVSGHGAAQGGGQTFHLPGEAFQRRFAGAAAHPAENEIGVLRSTTVPTPERLNAPLIRSFGGLTRPHRRLRSRLLPQCPDTRRPSISSVRWMICNASEALEPPDSVVHKRPRDGLC